MIYRGERWPRAKRYTIFCRVARDSLSRVRLADRHRARPSCTSRDLFLFFFLCASLFLFSSLRCAAVIYFGSWFDEECALISARFGPRERGLVLGRDMRIDVFMSKVPLRKKTRKFFALTPKFRCSHAKFGLSTENVIVNNAISVHLTIYLHNTRWNIPCWNNL